MGFTQTCITHIFLPLLFTLTDTEDVITIKATKGQKIPLPCSVSDDNLNKTYTVTWTKNGNTPVLCFYRVSDNITNSSNCLPRYAIEGQRLYLANVSFSDSGVYRCSVTRQIPPPTEEKVYLVDLTIQGVVIEKLNSSNQDCKELLCRTEGLDQDQLMFHWTRGTSGKDYNASQWLKLCKPNWSDCDTITCNVSHNNTSFSDTFILARSAECSTGIRKSTIIMWVVLPAGVVLISAVICCCCIYQKRKKTEDSNIVYTNKIYENFSFSTSGLASEPRKHEECIYEN